MRHINFRPVVTAISAGLLVGFIGSSVEAQNKGGARLAPSVVVDTVREKEVSRIGNFIGRVEALNSVDIRARVKGVLEARHLWMVKQ